MFEPDLFFLYTNDSCLLYQYSMSKKLGENLNKKIMISLLVTSYLQTESEIEEKTTRQP